MRGEVEHLVGEFARRPWTAAQFEKLVQLVRSRPDAAHFAEMALERIPSGGTFFDLTLSFVSLADFERLVPRALELLRGGETREAAESVIAYSALQLPAVLHPHLTEIFRLHPNAGTYYETWPWRESGPERHGPLIEIVRSTAPAEERERAWRCLLESRGEDAIDEAVQLAARLHLPHPVQLYLHEVGFDAAGRQLYPEEASHLVFPEGYFEDERPPWMRRASHPSWLVQGEAVECRFGGEGEGGCSLCGGALHHLITLPNECEVETCLSCLGWERQTLSYSHDASGRPRCLDTGTVEPQFPAGALKEATVRLVPTPDRWRWQDWALSNSRENLNRVGGHPSWVQSAAYPSCPICERVMSFILQLDSSLPTHDGGEWLWGSGGICYAFWCDPCRVSTLLWQCT